MRSIPGSLLADLKADCTTLAFLWTIEQADGVIIRGTEHDRDITIPLTGDSPIDKYAGTYKAIANITLKDIASSSDLSVDNTEADGAFADKTDDSPQFATAIDVSAAAIESGLLDLAPVTILVCNWAAPAHGYYIPKAGTLGQIKRDSDGKYTTEVRGLTQPLAQTIVRTFTIDCNVVKFGDHRCKLPIETFTLTGSVSSGSPITPTQFPVGFDSTLSVAAQFTGGVLTFLTGANAGFFRELKTDPFENGGILQTWEAFPNPIDLGDQFSLEAGCDRTWPTCKDIYNNGNNNRAYGRFIPGIMAITAGPTSPTGMQ